MLSKHGLYQVGAIYNGSRAELEFVLKLSGFFVIGAYAVLAVFFFIIMHFGRQREIQSYSRPRFAEDERDRQHCELSVPTSESAVQVHTIRHMPASFINLKGRALLNTVVYTFSLLA